jgi:hypothetical protein
MTSVLEITEKIQGPSPSEAEKEVQGQMIIIKLDAIQAFPTQRELDAIQAFPTQRELDAIQAFPTQRELDAIQAFPTQRELDAIPVVVR